MGVFLFGESKKVYTQRAYFGSALPIGNMNMYAMPMGLL